MLRFPVAIKMIRVDIRKIIREWKQRCFRSLIFYITSRDRHPCQWWIKPAYPDHYPPQKLLLLPQAPASIPYPFPSLSLLFCAGSLYCIRHSAIMASRSSSRKYYSAVPRLTARISPHSLRSEQVSIIPSMVFTTRRSKTSVTMIL